MDSQGTWEKAAKPETSAVTVKGELHSADQHIRDHFTLFLWVPTEQVGIIIGKKGAKIQYIQGATNTRVIMAAHASKEWESAWFQVMVKGSPSDCYMAAKIIGGLVEEVDDCVAQFPVSRVKHSLVIGKNGVTIRRISADTNVRIYVPSRNDETASNDIQLEGEVANVMKAVSMIMATVYQGGIDKRAAMTTTGATKEAHPQQHQHTDAEGEEGHEVANVEGGEGGGDDASDAIHPAAPTEAGDGEMTKKGGGRSKKGASTTAPGADLRKAAPTSSSSSSAEAPPPQPVIEETILVPLSKWRVLTYGKKVSAQNQICRYTNTKIRKELRPRRPPAAETETQGEGAERVEEQSKATELGLNEEVQDEEGNEATGKIVAVDEGEEEDGDGHGEDDLEGRKGDDDVEDHPAEEGEDEEEEGEEEGEHGGKERGKEKEGEVVGATSAVGERVEGSSVTEPAEDPLLKAFVRGQDEKSVRAAVKAIEKIVEGQDVKQVLAGLKAKAPKGVYGGGGRGGRGPYKPGGKRGGRGYRGGGGRGEGGGRSSRPPPAAKSS